MVNPDGLGANFFVRNAGYALPSFYSTKKAGNNIASTAAGQSTAQDVWSTIGNKMHLLGTQEFYAEQTEVGIGYAYNKDAEYQHYWIILTAPPTKE